MTFEKEKNKKENCNSIKVTEIICLFKKLLFTMENAVAADNSQSNISRIYIWKDKTVL